MERHYHVKARISELNLDDESKGRSSTECGREKADLGWLLYDGSCGFCRAWVPYWGKTLAKIGINTAPLQSSWVPDATKLLEKDLQSDILLLLKDGSLIRGADVYRFAMKRIWWARPFYFISILPGFRTLFNWSYRIFAENRFRISKACSLS